MISASRCHATMLCHSVRSCHSPALSLKRSLVARLNLATGTPLGVNLTSGSFPRFPTRITLFTLFAIEEISFTNVGKYTSGPEFHKAVANKKTADFYNSGVPAINLVQHNVNHDARDGDIEPYRKSPSGNSAVLVKPRL